MQGPLLLARTVPSNFLMVSASPSLSKDVAVNVVFLKALMHQDLPDAKILLNLVTLSLRHTSDPGKLKVSFGVL